MTYSEAYLSVRARLEKAGVEEAAIDAKYLIEYISGLTGADYLLRRSEQMPPEQLEKLEAVTVRREHREPLQYITGSQEFMGLPFVCTPGCLIPRQDTEILAEKAIETVREIKCSADRVRLLDLCTGSGCVVIAVSKLAGPDEAIGVDLSESALDAARTNAANNGVKVELLQSDLFEKVNGKFHIITANPPYIESGIIPGLMPEVSEFEPMLALDGGEDGLIFYRRIAAMAPQFLEDNGYLLFEIGDTQGCAVSDMMTVNGFEDVRVIRDLAGLDRVVVGVLRRKDNV